MGLKTVKKSNYFWDDDNFKIIPQKEKHHPNERFKKAALKSLLIILLLLLFFSFALIRAYKAKNDINNLTKNAKKHLGDTFTALNSGDISTALSGAEKSSGEIRLLRLNLQSWGQDMSSLSYLSDKKSKLSNMESLLRAADLSLTSIVELRQKIGSQFSGAVKISSEENAPLGEISINFDNNELNIFIDKTNRQLDQAIEILDSVDPKTVAIDNFDLESAKGSIKKLKQSVNLSVQILTQDLPWLTGAEGEKNLLILFVNNNELRGGGGFIGSFAIANFQNKTLKRLDFQTNIYKLDNKFTAGNTVMPPKEIGYLNQGKWSMRDSNHPLDFPESAAKVKEFYELESGQKVDGVMSLDTTLITDLLKITGPINMPEYNLDITNENFTKEVQYEVEQAYFDRAGGKQENEPKKILAQMMPRFINKILENFSDPQKLLPTIAAFSKAAAGKHLIFQFDKPDFQDRITKINYGGKISGFEDDFLIVSNTNIGGQKSSQNVAEKFIYSVEINNDGKQKSILEIERKHNGTNDWPDGYNKNLARILMPKGSEVTKFDPLLGNFVPLADKQHVNDPLSYAGEEAGYTKLSFWINTKPSETSKAALEYTTPLIYDLSQNEFFYKLRICKQLGSGIDQYTLKIYYPDGFVPLNVENFDAKNHEIIIDSKLDQDKTYIIKFKKV